MHTCKRLVARASITILLVAAGGVSAQWTTVGAGIEYREFSISGPNKLFVTRMDRSNTNAYIESSTGQGRLSGGTEIVRNQAARYDDAIGFWGENWGTRNDVVVAINGSYYNTSTGVPFGGVIHSGWYAKRHDNLGGMSGFGWSLGRAAFIGECITHHNFKQLVTYATSVTQEFRGINEPPATNQLTIWTPQYDTSTGTDDTVSEVVVQIDSPFLLMPAPASVSGVVRAIRPNQGGASLPFDHIVLSARGNAATTMLNNVQVGDTIQISQEIHSFKTDCATNRALDWTKTYASISSNWVFIRDGEIIYNIDSSGARHPRTAIGLNDDYVFFLVVDGRQAGYSIGMTINELAEFFKYTLDATWACNQDGGGSSTMVVNGVVKNRPSDGFPDASIERPVANGMLMVNLAPKVLSTTFSADQVVQTSSTANVRLGPGTNYGIITTLPGGTDGTVLEHSLNGVYAKGYFWWKVSFPNMAGWVAESLLVGGSGIIVSAGLDKQILLDRSTVLEGSITGGTPPYSIQWTPTAGLDNPQLLEPTASPTVTTLYTLTVTDAMSESDSDSVLVTVACSNIPGDLDCDGDVDQSDFGLFQACFTGPGVPQDDPDCVWAKLDDDDFVDEFDAAIFLACFSGPNVPGDPDCAGPFPPAITQDPANESVDTGQTAVFTVEASGTTPLNYRWQKNQVNLSDGGNISGATTHTLTVSNVQLSDAGSYRCVVTNNYGSATSNGATLEVFFVPPPLCLTNHDLETFTGGVATDWTACGDAAAFSASTDSHSGSYSQEIKWFSSGRKTTAIYQHVWVEVGVQYTVNAYFKMNDTNRVNGWLAVDFNGGTDPGVVDIGTSAPRLEWGSKALTFTKTSGEDGWATVFVGGYGSSVNANDWCRVDLITPACD